MHRKPRHALAAALSLVLISGAAATAHATDYVVKPANTTWNWTGSKGATPKEAYIRWLNQFAGGATAGNTVVETFCRPKMTMHLIAEVRSGKMFYGRDLRFAGPGPTGCS